MSLSVFYYCICACIRRCHNFNPYLCRLSPFHLSSVAVSGPCRLSEFTLTGPLELLASYLPFTELYFPLYCTCTAILTLFTVLKVY